MEPKQNQNSQDLKQHVLAVPAIALEVITKPAEFYGKMPKTGGFIPPLIFMIVMGALAGLLQSLLAFIGIGNGFASGIAAIILMPVLAGIFGFLGAGVLFVLWKILGSQESYETAYRCGAYTAAILPVTAVFNIIPYVGAIFGLLWTTYLLVVASTEVHRIATKKAWITFGSFCAILAFSSLSMEIAARKLSSGMENWKKGNDAQIEQLENINEMSPEEAGEALGKFLKAFGEAAEKE